MPTLNVIVKGIGICYGKNPDWKFLFPFDRHHRVRFNDGSGRTTPLAFPHETISILAANPTSRWGLVQSEFDNFVDVTAGYAHKDGIMSVQDSGCLGVSLVIKDGVFHQEEDTHCRYLLKSNGAATKPPAQIGYSARIELSGDQFTIASMHLPGSPMTVSGDTTIEFDNSCPGRSEDGDADFEMIYNLVQDARDPAREFTIERDPQDAPTLLDRIQNAIAKIMSPGGQKTVFDNPLKGEPGLPCNLVVAGDSTGLP